MTLRSLVLALALAAASGSNATEASAPRQPEVGRVPASAIPFKRETESTADVSGRLAVALLVCVAVGAGAIYLLRKRWAPGLGGVRNRRLHLLEVQRIGVKSSIVLVRWDEEELLISQGEGQMQVLARKAAVAGTRGETGDRP